MELMEHIHCCIASNAENAGDLAGALEACMDLVCLQHRQCQNSADVASSLSQIAALRKRQNQLPEATSKLKSALNIFVALNRESQSQKKFRKAEPPTLRKSVDAWAISS